MSRLSTILRELLIKLIRSYQYLVSPWLGQRCRYSPSCSAYALEAVSLHGGLRGGWLALRRIARCHPWAEPRHDPVPPGAVDSEERRLLENS